jgi:pentatricopeptide repeat protein
MLIEEICRLTNASLIQRERVHDLYYEGMAKFTNSRVLINGLLNAYSIMKQEALAENLFLEIGQKKIKLDPILFTSLVKCFYNSGSIEKAWNLYNERYVYINQEDDMLINTMINICAATHDAEKAKSLWEKLLAKGREVFMINDEDLD